MWINTSEYIIPCGNSVIQHVVCTYSDMCIVLSVTMKGEYELVSDAVLGTDLHFSEEYKTSCVLACLYLCGKSYCR